MERDSRGRFRGDRRQFLAAAGSLGVAALAGCSGTDSQGTATASADGASEGTPTLEDFRGSGLTERQADITAPRIEELPDLSGSLTIYLGGGEGGLYLDLLSLLERIYPDFEPVPRSAPSAQLANSIIEETQSGDSPADVFWAVDAGSLGIVAENDATVTLPSEVVGDVPKTYHPTDQWVGVAGRARSVAYNTDAFDEADVPDDVFAFAEDDAFADAMGWAPTYGAFQSFVTAMRVLNGPEKTKSWLRGMLDQGVTEYPNEFLVSNAVADGEIQAGFVNHYYALRVQAARPQAPLGLAFTKRDAGALVNVAGAAVIDGTDSEELATNFVRHLLSAEAQEFFATRTFAYPMVPGVPPVGDLPPIDQLQPPNLDLSKLSDIQPSLELMREVGVL